MQNRGPRAGVLDDQDEAELEELEAELASEEDPTAKTPSSQNASAALKWVSLPGTHVEPVQFHTSRGMRVGLNHRVKRNATPKTPMINDGCCTIG